MSNNQSAMSLVSGLAVAVLLVVGSLSHPAAITAAAPAFTAPVSLLESMRNRSIVNISPSDIMDVPDPSALTDVTPILVPPVAEVSARSVRPVVVGVSAIPSLSALFPGSLTMTQVPLALDHRTGGVPILMYHYIRVNPVASDTTGFNLSVTPKDFALQLRFLKSHGFSPVSVAEVRDYVRNRKPLPTNPIAITFDDGYADAYSAAIPILDQFHFSATFYVVTGFVDQPRYVSWDQVAAMDHDGMEIASHTVHHFSLTVLGALQRQSELVVSRSELERRLGHPILDFCYPGGQIDPSSEIAVARAGYLSATTTGRGRADIGADPLRLPRLRVAGGENLATFAAVLGL